MRGIRSILLLLALLIGGAASLGAQSLVLYNVDLSNYPEVGADVMIFGKDGAPARGFSASDFRVIDDDEDVSVTVRLDCPPTTDPSAIIAVLTNDRSASMADEAAFGRSRFDLLKEGITAFVNTIDFTPPTSVAITSFADEPSIVSDFRSSPDPLIASLASINLGGGTDYTAAFLDSRSGAIPLLLTQTDTVRRIVVFLTDGFPNNAPDVAAIVSAARAARVTIYTITVGTPMNEDLKTIAQMTGGQSFGNVQTEKEMRAIYQQIALTGKGYPSCHLRWGAHRDCASPSRSHLAQVTLKTLGVGDGLVYTVPPASMISLRAEPDLVWFGSGTPGVGIDKTVTLTAVNAPIDITTGSVTAGQPFTVQNWGGSPPPFTIPVGRSRTITIRFTPPDSGSYSANLAIGAVPCPMLPLTLVGGTRPRGAASSLRLLSPLGGETFTGCDSVTIRWGGVAPEDTVTLEYSSDGGENWQPITSTATGLSYRWMPAVPGAGYRIRVSMEASEDHVIRTAAGGGSGIDGGQATSALLSAPIGSAIADTILYFAESGDNRIRIVDFRSGIIKTLAGTGAPGYSNDGGQATAARLNNPNDVLLIGGNLYIADYSNHRIRVVDLSTGIITTMAGTGSSGFSGDGGPAIAADLQYPAYLAYGGGRLYFTDFGNSRIRRIDLATGRITTIAGGGSNQFSDGRPATEALLRAPAGIVVIGDTLFIAESGAARIRRVDLRTNIITTFAGNGTAGFGGDDGPADAAQFNTPIGVEAAAGALFVADAGNNRIRRVDFNTGIVTTFAGTGVAGFSGDGGNARNAKLDYPARPVSSSSALFFADVRNNRVRSVAFGRIAGRDASKSSFSVHVARAQVAPAIIGELVDLGRMAIGRMKDSIVTAAICNTGDIPLTIDSIVVAGVNRTDFRVAGGIVGTEIPAGACRSIELVFRPGAAGARSAIAILYGRCAADDTLRLAGTGIPPCNDSSLVFADLGTVGVMTSKDTILTTAICNRGTAAISGSVTLRPLDGPFSIIAGGGAFTLGPGECRQITIRFAPAAAGRASALLDYGIASECGALRTALYGEGISPQRLEGPDTIRFAGELCWSGARDTTIRLYNPGSDTLRITDMSLAANNEGFSIPPPLPSSSAPLLIPPGGYVSITLRLDPATPGSKSAALKILSNDPSGPATIELRGMRDSVHAMATNPVLNFGRPVGAGYPRDSFVVIRNTGTVPVTITGSTIDGADKDEFLLDPAQLPMTIPAGGSVQVAVRILRSADAGAFNASLRLTIDPACDSGVVRVALLQPGAFPLLSSEGPFFADLTCTGGAFSDTTITIRNDGGSQLRITGVTLVDDPEGNFSTPPFGPDPLTIEPEATGTIRIRFTPASTGRKQARLVIASNAEGGMTTIDLDVTFDRVAFTAAPSPLDFGVFTTSATGDAQLTIRNDGTTPLRWSLPAAAGRFQLISVTPQVADPGASSIAIYRFTGGPAGRHESMIDVTELRCSTRRTVTLVAVVSERVLTTIRMPKDSAMAGQRVLLPVRVVADDPAAFARIGTSGFTGTLHLDGISLVIDTLIGARITGRSFGPRGAGQTIRFDGTYTAGTGDPLMTIGGRTFGADTTWKSLELTEFTWEVSDLADSTVPGAFRVYGPCYIGQDIYVAAPRVAKISPLPISGMGRIELEVPEATLLRATLHDGRGYEARLLFDSYLLPGTRILDVDAAGLSSGTYTLLLTTPYAVVSHPIVVVK